VIDPPPGVDIRVLNDRGSTIELVANGEAGALLQVARWAYPGWAVTIDGRRVPSLAGPSGTLAFALPAGESHVRIVKKPPPARRAGVFVSLAAFGIGLFLALSWGRARKAPR
jgi:hypothetical protein